MEKAVTKKKTAEVIPFNDMFETDAQVGFEGMDDKDTATPRLKVLQPLSEELEDLDGAKPGDIYNSATNEWYKGKDYKTPAKSSCIGCPYHDDSFWLDMKNNRPDEFEAAVEFDKKMRNNSHKIKNYMHRSCKNLDEVVFHVKREEEQMDLFNNECEGMCGV